MKKLIFLAASLFLIAVSTTGLVTCDFVPNVKMLEFTKGGSYEDAWKKVSEFEAKSLPASALQVVEQIYTQAKTDSNYAQCVKAIIHKAKFKLQVEEDATKKIISDFQREADSAVFPLKPVLHSMMAEMYWMYYQQNYWQFYNRTETVGYTPEDIATWDLKRIVDATIDNYLLSLENQDSLRRTRIDLYDDILYSNGSTRKFRPTLYDFLAHRAVDFFANTEPDIARPVDQFNLDGEQYFNPWNEFIELNIETNDTMSLKFHAIKILQDLLIFHKTGESKEALVDVDLKRYKFLKNSSVNPDKDTLFFKAMQQMEKQYIDYPISTEISYEIAQVYYSKGLQYQPLMSDDNRWFLKKAYDYCGSSIKRFPDSHGSDNCRYLQNQIAMKNLSFSVEAFNLPAKSIKSQVSYKNLDKVYFRIVKLDRKKHRNDIRKLYGDEFIKYATGLSPIKEWDISLNDDGDYQNHTIEIAIPELETGYYLILASPQKDFGTDKNGVAYAYTTITSISYVDRRLNDESFEYCVMDRESGVPMAGVNAAMYKEEWNYTLQRYVYKKIRDYKTDSNGSFKIPPTEDYLTFFVEFTNGKDELYTNESFYQYRPYDYDNKRMVTHFFMDRAIYRPGQTVYFKGIVLETDDKNTRIVPNYRTTVTLYDANYQKVSDLVLTSNDYGTINGSFVLPQGVLTGQMRIDNYYGQKYFSVEEYKRPKFEVKFDPVKESFRLNDKIKVKGNAKAYAGSNIDGAKVAYRISRSAYFPYRYWYWSWYWPFNTAETVIKHGTATTNENGEFEIEFDAIPDLSIDKKWSPSFNYYISADVTDINGETRSASTTVSVGYKALLISTDIPQNLNKTKYSAFELKTTNLAGEKTPAKGNITISKLKENDKIFCKRKWGRSDQNQLSKDEFYEKFPFEMYSDEDDISKLPVEKKVAAMAFDTQSDEKIKLSDIRNWEQGRYVIEISTKDKYGEEVIYKNFFTVFDPSEEKAAVKSIDWFTPVNVNCEPGDEASFLVGTHEKDVHVLLEIEHENTIVSKEWIILSDSQKLIKIPVEEKHRGNFAFHATFVKHNNIFTFSSIVNVPYTNKELDISFSTFRDKLQPGEKEEWRLKVKGKNGDKVAAEMLATLYDASLDAFVQNSWYMNIYPYYYASLGWDGYNNFNYIGSNLYQNNWNPYYYYTNKGYDALNWFNFYFGYYYRGYFDDFTTAGAEMDMEVSMDEAEEAMPVGQSRSEVAKVAEKSVADGRTKDKMDAPAPPSSGMKDGDDRDLADTKKVASGEGMPPVKARTNFSETAFFFPELMTDEEGNVIVKFTVPEALTKWKMLGFAHTKDLRLGFIDNELVTQKELMVMPNVPRFLRENDKITITSKISNISEKDLSGDAELQLFDALTMKPIDDLLSNKGKKKTFTVKKGLSTNIEWKIEVPEGIQAVTYRIVARAGKFSDGEESTIPVLSNRMLVTESLPLPIRGNESKTFNFEKLLNSGKSSTLKHHKVTLEFTPNPAWYAVQALPYLIEYPYECAEQVFSRFYGNSIASHIANSDPKIKRVFDSWKNIPDSKALLSNLEKNQELKSVLLEETPWVLDAQDESARKRRVGLLFDLNHMSANIESAIQKLAKMQASSGGWVWFKGMPEDRYITQHIITGMGHLDHLGVKAVESDSRIWNMTYSGVRYLDDQIRKDYEWIKRNYPKEEWDLNHISYLQIQYLYARSYFLDRIEMQGRNKEAFEYFKGQAEKYWVDNGSMYMRGMIALAMHRFGETETANSIMKSVREHALNSDEMGMYWKENRWGYFWYEAPIETQALLIEAFDEITGNKKDVDDMRVWLLKQKQTQDWKTTKATTEAIYALLLKGTSWLATESGVEIKVAGRLLEPEKMDNVSVEPGTGYFKTSWSGSEVKPEMGKIEIVKKDEGVSWGAMYWQYFEQLDKITSHETPLKLEKQLFIEKDSDGGKTLVPVSKNKLAIGDKVVVRIELRVDRDMEYFHMKDMRASGFEPLNVISRYKYQDGLGYYESTRDVSTNFFISYLHKGTYVFEYPVRVTHTGDFSNGITTIQCMYAPEFTSHSEGIRVAVE